MASPWPVRQEEEEVDEDDHEEDFMEMAKPCEPGVALRLVAAASWHVIRERQVHHYPRVLALLEAVGEVAPELVHYRHFVKIRLGLQAKIVMTMLQEDQPHVKVYETMDRYFPEREPERHPKATAQDLRLVQEAQQNFRDLIFGLLRDRRNREKYVQEHLENDYGEVFLKVLEDLFCDYLTDLESALPEPNFQQLMKEASLRGPRQAPQPNVSILTQYLTAMGYQFKGLDDLPPSPNQSSSPFQSEEEEEEEEGPKTPKPCEPQTTPERPRRRSGPLGAEAVHLAGRHGTGGAQEVVLGSSSEEDSSPSRKDKYQSTRNNTLIPTFQEHLRDPGSQCPNCSASVTSPSV